MTESRDALEAALTRLQQERDKLQVKLHLASMDAKDEYDRLSGRVDELKKQYEPVSDAVGETATNVFSALGLAAEELQHGFGRVWKSIKDSAQ
ncbi:MAG: hypothetical protein AAF726_07340 [Planctomycetota bacterium]